MPGSIVQQHLLREQLRLYQVQHHLLAAETAYAEALHRSERQLQRVQDQLGARPLYSAMDAGSLRVDVGSDKAS